MTLENLLRIGKLKAHAAGKVEIDRLLAAAERALADASVEDLSSDSRLDLAYRAIMQAALAAMLANGYRPQRVSPGTRPVAITQPLGDSVHLRAVSTICGRNRTLDKTAAPYRD